MGRWTALALLGMLALLVSGSAGAAPWDVDENLSWSGYFKNETAYRYREPRSFTKIRNMLALEANYRFTDRIDLTAAGFFFSSRRRHTRLTCDWSSDVCSSDLAAPRSGHAAVDRAACNRAADRTCSRAEQSMAKQAMSNDGARDSADDSAGRCGGARSEERRVGKECRSRWSPDQ